MGVAAEAGVAAEVGVATEVGVAVNYFLMIVIVFIMSIFIIS